ncbi:MAG TPA: hypothetical protein VFU21_07300 [Kofleriaceae bacterium]|nr:hypothetical protein [Kofleriaceae bacterium]
MLVLSALALTGVAGTAEAKGGGKVGAAAAKMSRGAQIRLNRMTQKLSMSARGIQKQKPRRQLRLGKKQLMRAMGRREVGLHGSEAERTRAAFARDTGSSRQDNDQQEEEIQRSVKQQKKMRDRSVDRARRAAERAKRRNRD